LITIVFVTQYPKSILTKEDLEKYKQLLGDEEQDS
jgi:REP element-mobilizing transposase RayT